MAAGFASAGGRIAAYSGAWSGCRESFFGCFDDCRGAGSFSAAFGFFDRDWRHPDSGDGRESSHWTDQLPGMRRQREGSKDATAVRSVAESFDWHFGKVDCRFVARWVKPSCTLVQFAT